MKGFLFTLFMLASPQLFACSCVAFEASQFDKYSSHVFIGTTESIEEHPGLRKNKYTFAVTNVLKGNLESKVQVWAETEEAACGFNYKLGQEYLVYIDTDIEPFTSGLCSSWSTKSKYSKQDTGQAIEFYGTDKSSKGT